jgi:AcrR family transcriptional regulator
MSEKRKYELRRRAERQQETRRRIVDATVALHEEIGPAQTTISAIAARAGVERLTVYRHFPEETSLFAACGARFVEQRPPPDPAAWAAIADPAARLRAALRALYAYYRRTEPMRVNVERDAPRLPALQATLAAAEPYWEQMQATLLAGWEPAAEEPRLLPAALGHALAFQTWRDLARGRGLDDEQAVELMTRLVACAAGLTPR